MDIRIGKDIRKKIPDLSKIGIRFKKKSRIKFACFFINNSLLVATVTRLNQVFNQTQDNLLL